MDETQIGIAIETAKRAAEKSDAFKSETYIGVLLVSLLQVTGKESLSPQPPNDPVLAITKYKPFSSSEFFSNKNWTKENDRVVLAALYLERHVASSSFDAHDIRNCLLAAKIPVPGNINVPILRLVKRGLLMEVPKQKGGKKSWTLTQTGQQHAAGLTR